ncbi:hypothetical protein DL764_007484 [Monosporascus ibericus]|uniref:Uncharacterized protein n=1 Tax=Monosporascus ibericus TaxID=155417 RepID=A0A4Q4T0E3_9PEZI|nr:hypothetical protein DL764_007484 [Monosporascus ibericus]
MDLMFNGDSDSVVDSGKRGTRSSEQTAPVPSGARLLGLPAELRLQIWRTYSTWPRKPYLRYAADFGGGAELTLVKASLLFACKQIYAELWPILTANVQLHITYLSHSPCEALQFPSRRVCEWIQSMVFHCPAWSAFDEDTPPTTSIRFHRFRNLKTFTVCEPILVRVSQLLAEDGVTLMTRETYEASSEEKRLAAWGALTWMSADAIIAIAIRWGRGGWVSRVLDPEYHHQIHDLDDEAEDADEGSEEGTENYEPDDPFYSSNDEVIEEEARKKRRRNLEAMSMEVISKAHIMLEAELCLFDGSGYAPMPIQTLLVTIETRDKKIIESRLLSEEELYRRGEEASEAT